MRSEPMGETDGTFKDGWEKAKGPCPNCGVEGQHFVKEWESSCGGYVDFKFRCGACNKIHWVDGIDS